MNNSIIYMHYNSIADKAYIGKTVKNINARWRQHVSESNRNSELHFHRAIRKYPQDSWTHVVLEYNINTFSKLNQQEKYWIAYYDTFKGNGYNMTDGGEGSIIAKDVKNNIHVISADDPRYISGELYGIRKGTVNVKDINGNTMQVAIDDPRYISGELQFINIGMVSVKDINSNTMQVAIDDPRYISGELIHNTTGMVVVKDKNDNTMQVAIDDPRYISGELIGNRSGFVSVKNKNGNTMQVAIDDPRYISGELKHMFNDTVVVKDKNDNTMQVAIDDPRYISGEFIHINCMPFNTPHGIFNSGKQFTNWYLNEFNIPINHTTINAFLKRCERPLKIHSKLLKQLKYKNDILGKSPKQLKWYYI